MERQNIYETKCLKRIAFFLRQVLVFFGILVLCFPAFLLFCFFASLFLCFSAFPASLLVYFSAFCFCFSAFCFSCFLFFLLFMFLCSTCFFSFLRLLFCFSASAPFYFYYSTCSLLQSCVLLPTSCSFASLLPVFTASLFFLLLYSLLFCILNETLKTLGETQRNPKETLKYPR